jgi:glycosyltransferase involved in cell wall biosynthesis
MKIAYMLGSLNRGGTETLLLDCFRNAGKADFSFIGIFRKDGTLSYDFKNTSVPLFKLVTKHRFDIGYLYWLRKLIRKHNITIVHAQQPLDAIYARLACIGTSVKVVLTFHGFNFDAGRIENLMIRSIITHTNLNIFVSNAQKQEYQQHYHLHENRTKIVYNGISFDKLNISDSTDIRNELNIRPDTLLLGSVGNFVAVRDQLTLCRFLKLLHETNIDFRFLFIGARNSAEAWRYDDCVAFCKEAGLEEKVLFLGSRTDVPSILLRLDAFLYSTDHDTFGIAVIEAMASSIPVFVNDWSVMQEITQQGKYAHLYKTKDEQDLLIQLLQFQSDRDSYSRQAREAAIWAKKQYSIEQHLHNLSDIYNNLMK